MDTRHTGENMRNILTNIIGSTIIVTLMTMAALYRLDN
jgi:hypothetical protein